MTFFKSNFTKFLARFLLSLALALPLFPVCPLSLSLYLLLLPVFLFFFYCIKNNNLMYLNVYNLYTFCRFQNLLLSSAYMYTYKD